MFPPDAWRHAYLDLWWIQQELGGREGDFWTRGRGLVWSRKPIYCAAAVYVHNRDFRIVTAGWHGLTDDERESLEHYLETGIGK